ncbi:isoeugenol monooxygenase [Macrophomina phaseolina]|uniref:Isoeugenol monooxygenase n=1 Tax=Macrophomina phaseolina TaxID=35725 RepID=A0ABQ8G2W1_9PEZI|nr:isoeugenol monooxygenase [Macrophomina phaseolina]
MSSPNTQPPPPSDQAEPYGLRSLWSPYLKSPLRNYPCRWEGEIGELIVFGEIPKEINGTFYRIMADPFYEAEPDVPIEGDGNVSAFRIHNGRVEMKVKYVDTERLRLERAAGKRLFGLYRNPFSHHPCVQAAIDSTANTNLVFWAGKLLALKESALPYYLEPNTLETLGYDAFGSPSGAKTFSAHPKSDPYTNELVVYGYEARGLNTLDIVIYSIDEYGKHSDVQWIKSPWISFIHDCAITENFIILNVWPFEARSTERLKAGKQPHWVWNKNRPAAFIVAPRRPARAVAPGWEPSEHRIYEWDTCVAMHTSSAWEERTVDGKVKLFMESSRVMYNMLPFCEPSAEEVEEIGVSPNPHQEFHADYARWEFDLSQPTGTRIADPHIVLDVASEFPRMDERFMTRNFNWAVTPVILPGTEGVVVPPHLNGLAMIETKTGSTRYFNPGEGCHMPEPVFIPRSEDSPEGDGWVMAMVQRMAENISELVLLDTKTFETPTAVIRLPFQLTNQIHGNWVEGSKIGAYQSLVREIKKLNTPQPNID